MSFQVPGLARRRVPTCGVVCGEPLLSSFGVKSGLTTVIEGPEPGTGAKTTGSANAFWLTPIKPRRDNADTDARILSLAKAERLGIEDLLVPYAGKILNCGLAIRFAPVRTAEVEPEDDAATTSASGSSTGYLLGRSTNECQSGRLSGRHVTQGRRPAWPWSGGGLATGTELFGGLLIADESTVLDVMVQVRRSSTWSANCSARSWPGRQRLPIIPGEAASAGAEPGCSFARRRHRAPPAPPRGQRRLARGSPRRDIRHRGP